MKNQITPLFSAVLLVTILPSLILPSYVYSENFKDIKFKHLTVNDGLSHNEVTYVLQDSQGFMWFGTKYGLTKYDGIDTISFKHDPENKNSLCGDFVWWLQEGKDGALWIPTWGSGISKLAPKTGVIKNYYHDEKDPNSLGNDRVWSVYEDSKGQIWAATDSGGLNKYIPETDSWIRYINKLNDPNSISHNSVAVMQEDDHGVLWVGTYGGGLNKYDPVSETFNRYQHKKDDPDSLSNDNVWCVYIDSRKQIWVGTEAGLNKFDPHTETFINYQHEKNNLNSLSFNTVSAIYEDSKGSLWVGTFGGGLNLFDAKKGNFIRFQHNALNPNSILSDTITNMYEDQTGVLWISSYGGVDKYDIGASQFSHYQANVNNAGSLNSNLVKSIIEDKNGFVWIGAGGGGLNRFDKKSNTFLHYTHNDNDPSSISSNDVLTITEDKTGNIWIGTNGEGLNKFNPSDGKFSHYRYDPADTNTIGSDTIYDLAVDHKRNILWIASYTAGLDKYDLTNNKFYHYSYDESDPKGLKSNWVTSLLIDSDGKVWIGGEPGLSQFDPETEIFINYEHDRDDPKSLSSDLVHTVFEDSEGDIWIGTNKGLNKFDAPTQTFVRFFERDGLAGNRVTAIEEDENGYLWISTDNGLSHFNTKINKFRNYDKFDGLQENIFLANASFKNSKGELFFGGINGFNVFHPDNLKTNPHIPPVVLTDFQLFNRPVTIGGDSPLQKHINVARQIILSYDQSVFSIKFVALNYRKSAKNQYAYMMEGFDSDWTFVQSTRRLATYTNLDPGRYTFRVKASNNDGLWNEEGRSIEILILPPWWETLWFKYLMISFALTICFFVTIYVQKLRKEIVVRKKTEEELKESDERYRKLTENTSFGIGVSKGTELIYANAKLLDMFMLDSIERFNEKPPLSYLTPESKEKTKERIERLSQGVIVPEGFEVDIVRPDGQQRTLELGFSDITIDGESCRLSTYNDITDRTQAEEKLRISEERVRTWFETSPVCTKILDLDFNLRYMSRAGRDALKIDNVEEYYGKLYPFDFFPKEFKHAMLPKLEKAKKAKRGDNPITHEDWVVDVKGEKKWCFHATIVSVFDDEDNIDYLMVASNDVTERKQAEQALRESEERHRELTENLPQRIFQKDTNCVYVSCNGNFADDLGTSASEIEGKTDFDFFPKKLAEKYRADDLRIMETGKIEELEEGYITDGQKLTVQTVKVPLTDDYGNTNGILGIFWDITDRKLAEEEREKLQAQLNQAHKMEAVGRLAGGVAHDFNNMLSVILGHTEMTLEELTPDHQHYASLQEIKKAAQHSADITRQLLAFARKQTIAPRVLNLNKTLKSMLKMIRRLIGEDISLVWLPGKALWPVRMDASQIDQILANLCLNARDAIAGVGKITIETGRTTFDQAYCADHPGFIPGDFVVLAVSDDGYGMDKETLNNLFEPFFTTKDVDRGTGLGLATVYGIVKQNNGFINVYSEPGQGTTFKIYLPRHRVKTDALPEKVKRRPTEHGHETILLVEDEPSILKMTTQMLERLGYTILAAVTPEEAIRLAREHGSDIHLLMTDVIMPEMNGRDLASNLLSTYPNLKRLFMSGYTANVIAHHGVLDDDVNFIQKPFSKHDLAIKVREVLDEDKG